jgi:TolB-like protein
LNLSIRRFQFIIGCSLFLFSSEQVFPRDNFNFEPKNAAFFRLVSSGFDADEVDRFCLILESELESATNWDIMDYQTTANEIKKQGGDWLCSKADCATLNGQYLNVEYVIFGRVQTIGRSASITIQIADVSTGRLISDVSKFYNGKRSRFTKKVLPEVVELLSYDVKTILSTNSKLQVQPKKTVENLLSSRSNSAAFTDMRGYLSYSQDTTAKVVTDGKMAFGYLMIGANMSPDDVLRYSYQLQSYLSLVGAHAMLYIDEMELLLQVKSEDLKCSNKEDAKKIGRLLGVDFMGYGKISRIGKSFSIKTSIVDVESGEEIKEAVELYRGTEDVFLTSVIPDIAAQLGDAYEIHKKKLRASQMKNDSYSY